MKDIRQHVKVKGECSDLTTINRIVTQGSVVGPLLLNIFLNFLFYVQMNCEIANYAADENFCYAHHCDFALNTA